MKGLTMRNTVPAIILSISMIMLGYGCLSFSYHINGQEEYPYKSTSDCWNNCLCVWGRTPSNQIENAMDAYTKMIYPFWVVDFPFEIIMDTLFLPVDGILELVELRNH